MTILRTCPVPGCGGALPYPRASLCRACFARLPADLRARIVAAAKQQAWHVVGQISIEAVRWLKEHPRNAATARVLGEAPT